MAGFGVNALLGCHFELLFLLDYSTALASWEEELNNEGLSHGKGKVQQSPNITQKAR